MCVNSDSFHHCCAWLVTKTRKCFFIIIIKSDWIHCHYNADFVLKDKTRYSVMNQLTHNDLYLVIKNNKNDTEYVAWTWIHCLFSFLAQLLKHTFCHNWAHPLWNHYTPVLAASMITSLSLALLQIPASAISYCVSHLNISHLCKHFLTSCRTKVIPVCKYGQMQLTFMLRIFHGVFIVKHGT